MRALDRSDTVAPESKSDDYYLRLNSAADMAGQVLMIEKGIIETH